MRGAKQYESELQALRSFSNGNNFVEERIKSLEKTAKTGVTPASSLASDLAALSEKILKKTRLEKPNKTLLDKAALSLSSVVHVRKVAADEASAKTEDILARAAGAIESGNVEVALKEIDKLPMSEKEFLNGWIKKAQDFINIQTASEEIFQYVINVGNKEAQVRG